MPKRKKDFDYYKKKIETGQYISAGVFKRSMGRASIPATQKKELIELIEKSVADDDTSKKEAKKKKRTVRSGTDTNGAGESRIATLVKLMINGSRKDVLRLVAKSVDEGKTLPELHEELKEISKVLPSH